MQYRRLGDAGIRVSAVSLGGWINFEAKIPEAEARSIVRTAFESGVNFFDLADVYGYGEAERWMGAMLREYPRQRLVISTKVFWPMSDDVNDRGLSRKHVMDSIDASLERLGLDYVDIYFCHRPDPETPLLETARAMDDLIHQGKVLYWGTSEWEVDRLAEVYDLCLRHGLYPPQVEQPHYSMLHRARVEDDLIPVAEARGIGLVAFQALAAGLLTGKYDDGVPEDSRFAREPWAREALLTEANLERVRALRYVADELGVTRAQLAIAWALRHRAISSVITGATRESQLQETLGALAVPVTDDVARAVDAALHATV